MRNNFTRNDFNEKRSVRQHGIESREIGNRVFAHRASAVAEPRAHGKKRLRLEKRPYSAATSFLPALRFRQSMAKSVDMMSPKVR